MNSTGGTVKRIYPFGDKTGFFIEIEGIAGCFWDKGKCDLKQGDKIAVQFEGEYNERSPDSRKIEKLVKIE